MYEQVTAGKLIACSDIDEENINKCENKTFVTSLLVLETRSQLRGLN